MVVAVALGSRKKVIMEASRVGRKGGKDWLWPVNAGLCRKGQWRESPVDFLLLLVLTVSTEHSEVKSQSLSTAGVFVLLGSS